jgi:FlgD Ig-like domain
VAHPRHGRHAQGEPSEPDASGWFSKTSGPSRTGEFRETAMPGEAGAPGWPGETSGHREAGMPGAPGWPGEAGWRGEAGGYSEAGMPGQPGWPGAVGGYPEAADYRTAPQHPAPQHPAPQRAARPGRRRHRVGRKVVGLTAALAVVAGGLAVAFHSGGGGGGGRTTRTALAANDASVPMLGSSVKDAADLAHDTALFGHMPIVRVYYPGLPSATAWTTGLAGANRSAVIVSFKALPRDILSGADDAALRHFFDTAPTGHPIYYTYFHEPEDNIHAGQFKLADYKAAWARVVSLARAAHNPYLHSTLILMEWDLVRASGRHWKDYLPGGGIISVLGWDAYPVGSATNVHPQLTAAPNFMGPAIAASNSVGLPYGFAEFGLSTPSGRPAWLASIGRYLMTSGALFGSLFNGSDQYPTLQLTDRASVEVWRGYVRDSAVGANTPVNAPAQPTASPSASPSAATAGISGLALSPAGPTPAARTTISFALTKPSDVTICILNSHSVVVRQLTRPGQSSGQVAMAYDGRTTAGHPLPAGTYTVLVVASNAQGSATAEARLTAP